LEGVEGDGWEKVGAREEKRWDGGKRTKKKPTPEAGMGIMLVVRQRLGMGRTRGVDS